MMFNWSKWRMYGKRLSLKSRIGLGITISRLIFLPVIFMAVYYIAGMVNATKQIVTVDAKSAGLAEQIISEVTKMRRAEKNYLLLKDPNQLKEVKEIAQLVTVLSEDGLLISSSERTRFSELKESVRAYVGNLEAVSQGPHPPQDKAVVDQFAGLIQSYQRRLDGLISVAKQSKTPEQVTQSIDAITAEAMSFERYMVESVIASEPKRSKQLEELRQQGDKIDRLARTINDNSWKRVEDQRSLAEQLGHRATLLITVTLAVTLLLSFAFTWYLPRRVLQPIREMTQALRKASNGHYDVFLNLDAKDELGELVNEFHNLVKHIKARESENGQLGVLPTSRSEVRQGSFTVF
ncbi:MAG: HAMP domain-containing protein [Acidobacteriota bacterium]